MLLTVVLEEEVTVARQPYERSQGRVRGYRDDHREHQVSCGTGVIEIAMPRVSDTEETFLFLLLEAWQHRSKLLEETISWLYVEGLLTRDFKCALKPLWGKSSPSRFNILWANKALKESFNNWCRRDLSLEKIIYLLDGIYLGVRVNRLNKEAVLVAHGITHEGRRVVLRLSLGGRESTKSWKRVLNDLVERSLRRPQLITIDGNQGLLEAIKDIWPEVPQRRCAVHRIWNVLVRVSKQKWDEVREAVHRKFYAACLDDARDEAMQFVSHYSREFPTACEPLTRYLEGCLTFYRFLEREWRHICTGNVIEHSFREVKRRTRLFGRFPSEKLALVTIFSLLEEKRAKWQKVGMRAEDIVCTGEASSELEQEPIKLEFSGEALVG